MSHKLQGITLLFESERDVQAIEVLFKSAEEGSITFVVPPHVDQ
jgi:hypothetical protein